MPPPSGGRAEWRVTSVLSQAKSWRRRNSLPPSIPIIRGWSAAVRRGTQKERHDFRRAFLCITSKHRKCRRLLAAAPSGASQAFCRRQNLGGGGIHFRRAFQSSKGGAPPCGAEPKKKDTTKVVSFFLVDPKGFEPSTSRMRTERSPN